MAYAVARPAAELAVQELRKLVRHRLPEHMTPHAFVLLDALPLNSNGKLDRAALAARPLESAAAADAYAAPGTPVEEELAAIFAAVVGNGRGLRVGLYDSFFDLGGHSLLATQVVSRVREAFEVEVPLRALFEAPTVAELAVVVERQVIAELAGLSDDEVEARLGQEAGLV